MSNKTYSSLMVGDLLVEPTINKISHNLDAINLRPQVMELLVFLASSEGQVFSVERLLDELWPGKVVTEGTVYNCIGELRQAISSLDDSRTYIENIPKKGYRLSVVVERLRESRISPAATDEENGGSLSFRAKFVSALGGGLLTAIVVTLYVIWPGDVRSIAVLPFEDLSPGGDQAYLGNGIADELRLELQRLDGLRVAGRTSSIAYAQEDSEAIGKILDVDSIIEGSVRKEGGNVRITAQITHAADGFTIWSESYNRNLENIFELQEEIAISVAGALGVRLGVGTSNAFRGAGTRNLEAYELYLQTQNFDWTRFGVERKIRMLERAVELDPDYAAAWSFLGVLTFATAWDVLPYQASDILDRAYMLTLRGVQLDPESATAHSHLAVVRQARFEWIEAEQSHRSAMDVRLDGFNLDNYAWTLMRSGRTEYALTQWANARTQEPLDGNKPGQEWHAYVAQGAFGEAKKIVGQQSAPDRFEDSIDIALNENDPDKLKATIRAMPESYIAFGALYAPVLAEFDSPETILSILQDVYEDESVQWIRKFHDLAMLAAYFGDPQFALKVKSEDIRANVLRIAALWYPVMSDARRLPEFKHLVTELNLVEYWRAYGWADYCRPLGDEDFECH